MMRHYWMLDAELSQRAIMAMLGDQSIGECPASIDCVVHAQPLLIYLAEAGGLSPQSTA